MPAKRQYWLMKSEPESFSIDDLARAPKQTTFWGGVRNYQARNFMRAMKVGDGVLFYHSSVDPAAIVGTAVVSREAYPDYTALDPANEHYDPKASSDNPIWQMVDIKLDRIFEHQITLDELRAVKVLARMELLRRGSRLSVQPVRKQEWETVLGLADQLVRSTDQTRVRSSVKTSRKAAKPQRKKRKE